jgi:hydroxymethylpyrimidine pyrophosphatase-like HAD family hydrolase
VKEDEAQRLMLPTYKGLRVYIRPQGVTLLTVQCFDTQPGFRVSEWDVAQGHLNTEAAEQAGLALQAALQEALQAKYGTETTLSHKPMEAGTARFLAFTLFPKGVNKGAVLNLLLSAYMPRAQAVITVGDDDYNDLDLLQPDTFSASHRKLLNYPVVVGENGQAQRAVADNPRHELVELEHWDAGVARQIQRIKSACCSVMSEA